jgi:hypothetical protein
VPRGTAASPNKRLICWNVPSLPHQCPGPLPGPSVTFRSSPIRQGTYVTEHFNKALHKEKRNIGFAMTILQRRLTNTESVEELETEVLAPKRLWFFRASVGDGTSRTLAERLLPRCTSATAA